MQHVDWIIVLGLLVAIIVGALSTRKYTRSVADFLAANRCAGRYLLTVGAGASALGAITLIAMSEMVFVGGLTNVWWNMGQGVIFAFVLISGWIVYRFRQTRALTLAQFLEARYSRKFRLFAGIVCWVSGIINFGIFPSVSARFFMMVMGIPADAVLVGIPVYAIFLFVLIGTAYFFAVIGGQIAVLVTDFMQGTFMNIVIVALAISALVVIGVPAITETLMDAISAENRGLLETAAEQVVEGTPPEEIEFDRNPRAQLLRESLAFAVEEQRDYAELDKEQTMAAATFFIRENDSLVHPFKIHGKPDLNIWFYLISFWLALYSARIWQGSQGYNSAAATPHEARMGNVLASLRTLPWTTFGVVLPICALAWYNSDAFAAHADDINRFFAELGNPNLQRQNATPLAMLYFLPIGLRGAFVALMLAAFISTDNSYMHSWGSILIQDVIVPLRKQPFSQKTHLLMLRLSMLFVCVFIFFFSLIFRHTEYIVMFWNITGAIFTGGAGAVVIGGLYWKRGTTSAAWAAMITGSFLATGSVLLRQIHAANPFEHPVVQFIASQNGMVLAFWSGLIAITVYILVSLISREPAHNMDKLLHRGQYEVPEDDNKMAKEPVRGIRALIGLNNEFSPRDRFVYMICMGWVFLQVFVFIIGTAINLVRDVSDETWLIYWKWHIGVFIVGTLVVAVWFAIGGTRDIIKLYRALAAAQIDENDDGRVLEKDKA